MSQRRSPAHGRTAGTGEIVRIILSLIKDSLVKNLYCEESLVKSAKKAKKCAEVKVVCFLRTSSYEFAMIAYDHGDGPAQPLWPPRD